MTHGVNSGMWQLISLDSVVVSEGKGCKLPKTPSSQNQSYRLSGVPCKTEIYQTTINTKQKCSWVSCRTRGGSPAPKNKTKSTHTIPGFPGRTTGGTHDVGNVCAEVQIMLSVFSAPVKEARRQSRQMGTTESRLTWRESVGRQEARMADWSRVKELVRVHSRGCCACVHLFLGTLP